MKRRKAAPREPQQISEEEFFRSQVRGGIGSGRGLHEKFREKLGVPYAFLTQSQFEEIQSKAALSDHAQFELNIALRRYWTSSVETTVSPKTIIQIDLAENALEGALGAVAAILNNDEFYSGPIKHFHHTPLEQSDILEKTMETMMRAQKIMHDAQKRFVRKRGAPPLYGPLRELIHHLDFILYKSHGIVLTRSNNRIRFNGATDTPFEYVWSVVKVANLKVPKDTVDSVLRDYIKDRDKNDRMFSDRTL